LIAAIILLLLELRLKQQYLTQIIVNNKHPAIIAAIRKIDTVFSSFTNVGANEMDGDDVGRNDIDGCAVGG
jgi:hypothetical protein